MPSYDKAELYLNPPFEETVENFEIQVLTGLHAGARFPLNAGSFTLGGDEADLRLLDESFETVLLAFETLESGALRVVSGEGYALVSEHGKLLTGVARWAAGQFLKVADVWFALMPRAAALAQAPELKIPVVEMASELAEPAVEAGLDFDLPQSGEDDRFAAPAAARAQGGADETAYDAHFSSRLALRRKAAAGLVGGVLAILVVGFGFAGMPSEANVSVPAEAKAPQAPLVAPKSLVAQPAPVPALKPQVPSLQQVKEYAESLLEDNGLKGAVSARVSEGQIKLGGSLERNRVRDLDHMVYQLESRYGADYKIAGQVETISTAPNFRIREVVMGKDGWIVTDTGRRVLIGGQIGGYRLVSIDARKVVMVGPERLEIDL